MHVCSKCIYHITSNNSFPSYNLTVLPWYLVHYTHCTQFVINAYKSIHWQKLSALHRIAVTAPNFYKALIIKHME